MTRGEAALRGVVSGCLLAASAALLILPAMGHGHEGLALAGGLGVGSTNGWLAQRALSSPVGFGLSSLGRLLLLTAAALGLGALLGGFAIAFAAGGVALAQLILAGAAAREALRL